MKDENESLEKITGLVVLVIYAALTWFWFYLNNSNSLPLIGHTELVRGWIYPGADKVKLFFDLVYFALSVAVFIIATEVILSEISIPFLEFKKDSSFEAAMGVNFIVLLYEFHILEFRLKLIGLTIGLIIFFVIGLFIAEKVLEILRPILGIMDAAENIADAIDADDKQK